ncbi:MAG: hypothetical protein AAF984_01620, partial [Verrucomicrobiota bacterium]
HIQEIKQEPQVKLSRHLAYLRTHGIVSAIRHQNWMIYHLPRNRTAELEKNLSCLQDSAQTHPIFKNDLKKRNELMPQIEWLNKVSSELGCHVNDSKEIKTQGS